MHWERILCAGLVLGAYIANVVSDSFAQSPASFSAKEYEQRVAEAYNPAFGGRGTRGQNKDLQGDPTLARVTRPNMYCTNSAGGLISGCGVPSGSETSDWSGGQRRRDIIRPPANGLRADLSMSSGLANMYTQSLASPVTQIATTYVYADAGAAAGMAQGHQYTDGALDAFKLALDSLNFQAQRDPVAGEMVALAFNGCVKNSLLGTANGNYAQALSLCLNDRPSSAGNYAVIAGEGATFADVPDHTAQGTATGTLLNTTHSVWKDIFNPLINAPPPPTGGAQKATSADYKQLYLDALRLTGDVEYQEGPKTIGATEIKLVRTSPQQDASVLFKEIHKKVWIALNALEYKLCLYVSDKDDIDLDNYDPLPLSAILKGNDFWSSIDSPAVGSWTAPSTSELVLISFQSFRFTSVAADLIFAGFMANQEGKSAGPSVLQNSEQGKGRKLDCDEFLTGVGDPAEFERLLADSGGSSFSAKKMKEWRQSLFDLSRRVALGQWLGTLRVMLAFLKSVGPSVARTSSAELAQRMVLETAGVETVDELERGFLNNREEIRKQFDLMQQSYASELQRGAGTISEMFVDAERAQANSGSMGGISAGGS